ncbi:hypothetical protein E3N88_41524 [Mikania micrantha]|uniref:General transcription and DNA repair factor IIH subunit TFB4 n=1 Tax=Mikania micrantha TaxID=192012 RepID=A0A5N6LKD8_9ASTR|nr:hypothetical protein E3N88_41524 [Mikania micrantha]
MADGTRFRVIDDNIKALQDFQKQSAVSQSELQSEVSLIATSLEDTKKIMNKVLVRLDSLTPKEKFKHTEHGPNSSGNEGSSILGRHKPTPIYLPRFSGTHPERWVAQANRYFDFYSIDDTDRLTISSFYLDDVAADWYDWLCRHSKFHGWKQFTADVIQRFKARDLEEPEGILAKLQQTSTVEEYRTRFEEVSTRTIELPAAFMVSCFVSGLRSDIKQSVVIHQPTTVDEAMKYAQLHETRLQLEKGVGRPFLNSSSSNPAVHFIQSGISSNISIRLGRSRLSHFVLKFNSSTNQLNQVMVIATGLNSCDYIYDSSLGPTTRELIPCCRNWRSFVIKEELNKDDSVDGFGLPCFLDLFQWHSVVPIDSCVIGSQHFGISATGFLYNRGVYLKPQQLDGLFQYLTTVFATDLHSRSFLQLPKPVGVDFRASSAFGQPQTGVESETKSFLKSN